MNAGTPFTAVHYGGCPGRFGLTASAARNEGARDAAHEFIRELEGEIAT